MHEVFSGNLRCYGCDLHIRSQYSRVFVQSSDDDGVVVGVISILKLYQAMCHTEPISLIYWDTFRRVCMYKLRVILF